MVSPRERFDVAVASLDSIIEHTDVPYELVYVDGGSSKDVRQQLADRCRAHGFAFIEAGAAITPNEARNLGSRRTDTPWIVFADNDLLVEPGWLAPLVACGDETGADAVTPLLFQGSTDAREIHIAGGYMDWSGEAPHRTFTDDHRHQGRRLPDPDLVLEREPCDFVEFHCCLVRRSALDALGGLDEELRSTREHIDLSLSIAAKGGTLWFEPTSWVTYHSPTKIRPRDVPYYCRRWSDARTSASLAHFCRKWGVDGSYATKYTTKSRRDIVFNPVVEAVRHRAGDRVANLTLRTLRASERRVGGVAFGRAEARRRSPQS